MRHVIFDLVKVPRTTSLEKGLLIPPGDHLTIVYLDNFDELRIIKRFSDSMDTEGRVRANRRPCQVQPGV